MKYFFKCFQAVEGQMFNTFLEELKEQLRNKTSFWARIKEGRLTAWFLYKPVSAICKLLLDLR